jgi:hypothetical protein
MTIFWFLVVLAVMCLIIYIRASRKAKFWDSIKVGDVVIGSGIGDYHVRETVLEKSDELIRLSDSGLMSRAKFMYGGELEYFSEKDWYSLGV